jgi:F0F1-type ATP synthase assembly protein I
MMQKFGLYDVIANLIPGLAFLWALSWLGQFLGHTPIIPISGSIGDASVLIAWAYIVGLLIQGVAQSAVERIVLAVTGGFPSSRWLIDGGEGFTEEHRSQLKEAIHDYFGEPVEPKIPKDTDEKISKKLRLRKYQELFYLCYNLVDQKKLSDRPLAFNAHYGLFRALLTFSLSLLIVYGSALLWKWNEIAQRNSLGLFECVLSFLVLASVVSYFRMKKRGEDFAKSIYGLFYAFYRQEKGEKK